VCIILQSLFQILLPQNLKKEIKNIIDNINDWFRGNSLSLNFDKSYFLQFRTEDSYEIDIKNL